MKEKVSTVLVLVYNEMEKKILLSKKKKGIGAGFLNGPGGHVEEGETPMTAAIREMKEEWGVAPVGLEFAGVNHFMTKFTPDQVFEVHVFLALAYKGELTESDEMGEFQWHHADKLPFDQMWPDVQHWIPNFLQGDIWFGSFEYDAGLAITRKAIY